MPLLVHLRQVSRPLPAAFQQSPQPPRRQIGLSRPAARFQPRPPASTQPNAASRASSSGGVVPAGDCGCGGGGGGGGAKKSYIFAIGNIGFDFGTEAGRDAFRQLMKRVETTGKPPVSLPPNPYDVIQLVDYLDGTGYPQPHKYDSTKLIWTLNLDATPIYAIEAELAYAEDVYEVLRSALRNQALPTADENYVSRVSIPGVLTGKTRRLFSGQIVPVVIAQPRGLYTWNETALVDQIVQGVLDAQPDTSEDFLRLTIRNFLDKIYYQLRNLGQTSSDRALNYSATNAFIFAEVVQQGLLTAQNLPGAPDRSLHPRHHRRLKEPLLPHGLGLLGRGGNVLRSGERSQGQERLPVHDRRKRRNAGEPCTDASVLHRILIPSS